MTFQPKARYLSASGSTVMTALTRPSICSLFLSTMQQRLSRPKWPAAIAASQMLPSWCSPSPVTQYTRQPAPAMRPAMAAPTAMPSPWPSEPLDTSRPASAGAWGCPWKGLPSLRRLTACSSVWYPASTSAA